MLSWTFLIQKLIFSARSESLVRKIAWISLISVSLSVAAFILVLSVMSGMNASIEKRVMGIEPHLVITADQQASKLPAVLTHEIESYSGGRSYPFEKQDVIVRTVDGLFRGAIARGVTVHSLQRMIYQIQALDPLKKKDALQILSEEELPHQGEIYLGIDLARVLGVFEGDEVSLFQPESLLAPVDEAMTFEKVKIKKIISTNIADVDAQMIYYSLGSLKKLQNSLSRTQGYEVFFTDGNDALRFRKTAATDAGLAGWSVMSWADLNSALFFALKLEKTMIGIFLGLAGVISVASILTVMALLMSQKRKDIALFKTMGLSAKATLKTFAGVGFLLSMMGVGVGLFIGTGISMWIEAHPLQILPDIYYDNTIPARVNALFVAFILLVSTVLCWLASFWPAKQTMAIVPSEILRQ